MIPNELMPEFFEEKLQEMIPGAGTGLRFSSKNNLVHVKAVGKEVKIATDNKATSEEVRGFLNEDSLDNIADNIHDLATEHDDDPLLNILNILDTHMRLGPGATANDKMKTSCEIFVDKTKDSVKIAFLNDSRKTHVSGFQKFMEKQKD